MIYVVNPWGAAQAEGKGSGCEQTSSEVEGMWGWDPGAGTTFLALLLTWGNSLLLSVSHLSFVKLIIISL